MPDFSLHLPRFLRSRRSQSKKPSTGRPRDGTTTSPSSDPGVQEQDTPTADGTSRPPSPVHPQGSVDRYLHNFSGQPSQANAIDSQSAQTPSPHDSALPQPTYLPCLPVVTDTSQSQQSLVPQCSPYLLATSSRNVSDSRSLTPSSNQYLPQPRYKKQGILNRAHDFSASGNFIDIDGNVGCVTLTSNVHSSNQFMEKLLKETIPGAASDSSARYPPPRCHPGTRLAILERCIHFITHGKEGKKMRWVVGAAGVGKSAIMQNVAESPKLSGTHQASVFLSISGRNDGSRVVITLSYQLAAESESYREVIEDQITRNPSLLQSSLPVQFQKFIINPFIHNAHLNTAGRVVIIIDGLDECSSSRHQLELLRLISDFCISHPSSPIVWLISSRPETHITSFFSRAELMPIYEKEDVPVDSSEARADVERFLRDELTEIRKASDSLDAQWPDERDLWKLANASGGLFAYAHTVVRYIGDSTVGSPASQLFDVLNVIDNHPITDVSREEHPMALLDALYARILSNVPSKIMINARKILLALASNWNTIYGDGSFVVLCNWLHMTPDEAYAAINHLRSVLLVPRRDKAQGERLEPFHKSFIDYVSDFSRSGFSLDILQEARQIRSQSAFRVLKEAPDGFDFTDDHSAAILHGVLARHGGTGDQISLSWPADKGGWNDHEMRSNMYKLAIGEVAAGMNRGDQTFQSLFCIRLLITRFQRYYGDFPHYVLRDLVFDESRRQEFMTLGILKQIPVKAVDTSKCNEYREVDVQFRCPATVMTLPHPWKSSDGHEQDGQGEQGKDRILKTSFYPMESSLSLERLERQLKSWITRSPDHPVPVMFTATGSCCVEIRLVDLEDDVSEWSYWLWVNLSWEEREKLGSTV